MLRRFAKATTLLLLAPILLSACERSESYKQVALDDPVLAEFTEMHAVDRALAGLPELPAKADVRVERATGKSYDIMLHVEAKTSRTIAFKRIDGRIQWVHEQVIVRGPGTHTTVDGTFKEEIVLTLETEPISGADLGVLNLSYSGPDPVLSRNAALTIGDVRPLLTSWLGGE